MSLKVVMCTDYEYQLIASVINFLDTCSNRYQVKEHTLLDFIYVSNELLYILKLN